MSSAVNWPPDFDPAKHRAYIGQDGKAVFIDIPPEVLALAYVEPGEGGNPFASRAERARALAAKGHVIDTQIDVWGWGAENTMNARRLYGRTWVPDALGELRILVPPER